MTFRIHKNKDYTVISNHHLRDKNLSLKAKGLLSQMLSLPDDWQYSVEFLVSMNREEKTAITTALKELKKAGYITVNQKRNRENGQIAYEYNVYEIPNSPYIGFPSTENPLTENPYTENPLTENPPLLNTNILNTNKPNTNILNTNKFIIPTVDEVRTYCQERNNNIDPEAFIDHYNSNGWKVGKNAMKDWKAAVRQWERSDYSTGRKSKSEPMENKSYDMADIDALFAGDLIGENK